ncbi:MAG: NUDIX domain-containing protein [Caldilineales bacterium]|nr:NUDIX domain-containing protein [Caldilineales bacterium]MDW8318094.1 NUDIX domain-containing protein [Anaerolineae bacterium]
MKTATACIVYRSAPLRQVLLGRKQYGFGNGKYGGFGGKVEPGEAPEDAAARELAEEAGLVASPADLELVARLTFLFPYRPAWDHRVFAFWVHRWQGEPRPSAEMVPCWFDVSELPYDAMWDDARFWLPLVLAGKRFDATFVFRADNDTVDRAEFQMWPADGQEAQRAS